MENRVFNLIILDQSGSMRRIKSVALDGINETLQTIRSEQERHPEMQQIVSVLMFGGTDIDMVRDCVKIDEVNDLYDTEYKPSGNTPLYDAIGRGITSVREKVVADDAVIVTIITDGEENSSAKYDHASVSRLISQYKEEGWLFSYIGANQDSYRVARGLNIDNALNFKQDDEGVRGMFDKDRRARGRFMDMLISCMEREAPSHAIRNLVKDVDYFQEEEKDADSPDK